MNDAATPDRRIAITIDDLPWQSMADTPDGLVTARHAQRLEQLRVAHAPVVGFVNEGKLEVDGQIRVSRLALLRDWLEAGHDLGNHNLGQVDLHEVGLTAHRADMLRGERQLRPFLAQYGEQPRWFRHPYLRAGTTQEEKKAIGDFLAEHGYRNAPVTVDNALWIWVAAYRKVLDGQPNTMSRAATLARLQRGYVAYMLNKVDYYEVQSQQLLGHALPKVWLLHANALNAVAYAELVDGVRRRGYRTIRLDEALADPA